MSNFSAISWREQVIHFDEMLMMMSALFQTNMLSWIFIVLDFWLTETIFCMQTCCSTLTHYSDSKPTSLCSYSLVLCAQRRSNKHQFYCPWFDPTGAQIQIDRTRGKHANHYNTYVVGGGKMFREMKHSGMVNMMQCSGR